MKLTVRLAALMLPMILGAQAPAKYRYISTSTNYLEKGAFDRSIETMKRAGIDVTAAAATNGAVTQTVTSVVSLSTRDSAGGTIYQINVDSSVVDEGTYRKADRAARAIASPGTKLPALQTTQPARVVTVFVKNGRPVSLAINGRPAPDQIDTKHPWSSLQLQLPGLVYLIPSADMPANVNGVYQDTVHVSRTTSSDTVTTVWHRASADTVHSVVNKTSVWKSDGVPTRALSSALYELVFDGTRRLRGVKGTANVTTTTPAANGNNATPVRSEQSHSLVKMS